TRPRDVATRAIGIKETRLIAGAFDSYAYAGVAEKREAKLGIAADTVQAILRDVGDLADRVGAEIGKLLGLETAKYLLGRIRLWCIAWQPLHRQPGALAIDPVRDAPAAMGWQTVPQEHHRTPSFELMQFHQELEQAQAVVGARTQLKDEVRITAIGLIHQRCSQRKPFPHKPVAQHWSVTSGRPGGAHRRQQRNARFVLEHD